MHSIEQAPVFIIGAPRSGTTWLNQLLLSDSRCLGGVETHFFADIDGFIEKQRSRFPDNQNGLLSFIGETGLKEAIRDFWNAIYEDALRNSPDAQIVIEKTPSHALTIPNILSVLPAARFIHVVRDSRAVTASLLAASKTSWGKAWAPKNCRAAAKLWQLHVTSAISTLSKLPTTTYHQMHYESLNTEPVAELRKIMEFLGLASDEGYLTDIVERNTVEKTKKNIGVRKGGNETWRQDLSAIQQQIVWLTTSKKMMQLGYKK